MKKVFRIILKILSAIVLSLVLYISAAWLLSKITIKAELPAEDEVAIYILNNGVHTDIVMPVASDQIDWSTKIMYDHAEAVDSTYNFIAVGWGDKGFYLDTPTWAELKVSTAFKAAFGLSTTAMHTTFYKAIEQGEDCKQIMVSQEQYSRLIDYVTGSFQSRADGSFIQVVTDANYGSTDAFYEAHGKYSMIKTCNSWANKALKKSGQKACLWTAFDTGIFEKYEG